MKSILFVEDERWGVNRYFSILEKKEFKCNLVKTGNEAVEILKTEKFDLISMDIMFPPGNALGTDIEPEKAGARLLEMIRKGEIENCDPNVKVVILTAVNDYSIEIEIKKLGVSAYLKKPIDTSGVIKTFFELS